MATSPDNPLAAHAAALPTPRSLPEAARAAVSVRMPLVVMTTLKGCPYCDVVRGHYLLPMQRAGQIQAIQLDMTDRRTPLTGFDGRNTTATEQVKAWKARLAPTVLFLGPTGQELVERLVGMTVPDMYGSYLESRLEDARQQLAALPRS